MEVALYRPEIPPNTGNIARLCVCTATPLHIIGRPSFFLDERAVRRAGLDYWDRLQLTRHTDWRAFVELCDSRQDRKGELLLISKFGRKDYWDHAFGRDDILIFGQETSGVPEFVHEEIRGRNPENILRIPMAEGERSLNLANAVSIVLYEGLRQLRPIV